MKKILYKMGFVCTLSILLAASCKKNTDSDPLEQLPPETQTGANTFGCLVNGNVFKPRDNGSLLPALSCFYQLIYSTPNGYVFGLGAYDRISTPHRTIYLSMDCGTIEQGKLYYLTIMKNGTAGGGFSNGIDFNSKVYETNESVTGELFIKKFDKINQIVAGTFWYNAINALGDTVKITNGRFDVKYTR